MNSSCSAYQASCQERCRADIPFWKIGQRRECQQQCDVEYTECYAQLVEETEAQTAALAITGNEDLKKLIVIIIAIVVIIVAFFLWRKYRKG